MGALRDAFRPEFLNRVDEIVLFDRLKRDQLDDIVQMHQRRRPPGGRARHHAGRRHASAEARDPAQGAGTPGAGDAVVGQFVDGDTVVVDADAEGLVTLVRGERTEA